jgi:hypothetical protein
LLDHVVNATAGTEFESLLREWGRLSFDPFDVSDWTPVQAQQVWRRWSV